MGGVTTWTEEQIAILIAERAAGTRRRYIAEIINSRTGSSFSKMAVCGKIDRIFTAVKPIKTEEEKAATKARSRERDRLKKQARRAKAGYVRGPRLRAQPPRVNTRKLSIVRANGNSSAMQVVYSIETTLPELRCVEIEPCHISLVDLEPHHCRHPYGDGPFTFCGHPKLDNKSSYCMPHHDLCYRPMLPLTDKKWSAAA